MKVREGLFLSIMLSERKSKFFLAAVVIGIAFSLAVILGTVGIMDGFEKTLKTGLNHSEGDILLSSRTGFFEYEGRLSSVFTELNIVEHTEVAQLEAFMLAEGSARGVLVRAVDPESFSAVTGLELQIEGTEAILGSGLLSKMNLDIGDSFALTMADHEGQPRIERFQVKDVISHGLFEKDSRYIYVSRAKVDQLLKLKGQINLVLLNSPLEDLDAFLTLLNNDLYLDHDYITKPFWFDFATLLEAVKVEKIMIGLILQIIVIVSLFNVVAFTAFLNEKRARDLFLLQALGLSKTKLRLSWLLLMLMIWGLGCSLSLGFVALFRVLLQKLSLFELPGEVYHLARLNLEVGLFDYILVFGGALIWLLLLSLRNLRNLTRGSILAGLRSEFSS